MENENEYIDVEPQNIVNVFKGTMDFEDLNESEQQCYQIFILGIELGTNIGINYALNSFEQGLHNLRENEANDKKAAEQESNDKPILHMMKSVDSSILDADFVDKMEKGEFIQESNVETKDETSEE